MKVLFVSRLTIHSVLGGDTIQMENTARELSKFGTTVEFYTVKTKDFSSFDLIHFFNITRPEVILNVLSKVDLPFVLSPIYVDYSFYKTQSPFSKMGLLTRLFGADGIEYFKAVFKHVLGKEKIYFNPYFLLGQKSSIKRILRQAAYILPNSESENTRLVKRFGHSSLAQVTPNGVDLEKFKLDKSFERQDSKILCVASVEPRKNQFNLIKAINGSKFELTIIGNPSPNHHKYYEKCKAEAGDNVTFISKISQSELVKYYLESSIHILPSWFETTGLSSLEAAYLGCKIIVSPNGDTKDYFKGFATYCERQSVKSIKKAIHTSSEQPYTDEFKEFIKKEYNWKKTAEITQSVYLKVLKL
jgi:glycosyltransferase involved in cell wall biosynthesis